MVDLVAVPFKNVCVQSKDVTSYDYIITSLLVNVLSFLIMVSIVIPTTILANWLEYFAITVSYMTNITIVSVI